MAAFDQNLIVEAGAHITTSYRKAERALGEMHAICLEFRWRLAQVAYKRHFFGGDDSRDSYLRSVEMSVGFLDQSVETLGIGHPTTLAIWASLQLCFEEQLEWTLDDIPRRIFEALDETPRPPGLKVFWK